MADTKSRPAMLTRVRLFRLCLVIMGLALGLGVVEVFARILQPHARDTAIPGRVFTIDDDLGWRFRPNKTSRHRTRYFDTTYTMNSLGFRDKPREALPLGETRRVVLYGDSLVFGWGVAEGERFSDIVEERMPALEVWNHAVPGYGLDQEILLYEKERRTLPVHEAVFFVGVSTLSRIRTGSIFAKYKPMFVQEPDGQLKLIGVPKVKNAAVSVLYDMLSPLYSPYLLQTAAANLQAIVNRRHAAGGEPPQTIEQRRDIGPFELALLSRAARMSREANHRISILVANLSQTDRGTLRAFCRDNSITFLEISPDISATASADVMNGLVFGEHDKHWNAKANALIAQQLLSQMLDQPLLK